MGRHIWKYILIFSAVEFVIFIPSSKNFQVPPPPRTLLCTCKWWHLSVEEDILHQEQGCATYWLLVLRQIISPCGLHYLHLQNKDEVISSETIEIIYWEILCQLKSKRLLKLQWFLLSYKNSLGSGSQYLEVEMTLLIGIWYNVIELSLQCILC